MNENGRMPQQAVYKKLNLLNCPVLSSIMVSYLLLLNTSHH